jgi:fructokinase
MRIGIDLGGTKIEGIALDAADVVRARRRVSTPKGDYAATVAAVAGLVADLEAEAGADGLPVGIATPGAVSPVTGRMKNCNSTWLNDRPLAADLAGALGREPRLANDANCLASSEAADGSGAGARVVFGAILGTGVGGGVVVDGRVLAGANAVAGEWGHNPLPWTRPEDLPEPACWCGRRGCIETRLSGPGLVRDYQETTGKAAEAPQVVARAEAGEADAVACLERYEERLARGLAVVINLLDPDVVVLGGGLSRIGRLYRRVPLIWGAHVFSDRVDTRLEAPLHGDASGVRGATRLWPPDAG